MITYFIGNARDYGAYALTIQFPADTIHITKPAQCEGRRGPAVVFVAANAYDLPDYRAVRDRLTANHPEALLIRLR